MARTVALLRGINVGGRSLPMADLRSCIEAAGGTDVATYIQSGNVVFTPPARTTGAALESRLEAQLAADTSKAISVLVRTAAELGDLLDHNPWPGTAGTKLVVWFCRDEADAVRYSAADVAPFAPETLTRRGRDIYLFLPDGQGRSPMLSMLDKVRPRGTITARNWNTVAKLHQLATDERP